MKLPNHITCVAKKDKDTLVINIEGRVENAWGSKRGFEIDLRGKVWISSKRILFANKRAKVTIVCVPPRKGIEPDFVLSYSPEEKIFVLEITAKLKPQRWENEKILLFKNDEIVVIFAGEELVNTVAEISRRKEEGRNSSDVV